MRSYVLAFAVVALVAGRAVAQDTSAQVEALFAEGKRLKDAGNYAEACPKFLASYKLEKRLGTLINLADCYEKNGQLASAWARFVEAKTLAERANQRERADYATQHAALLEAKVSKLTITVPHLAQGEVVSLDGTAIESGAFGIAVAIDSGPHKVEAGAPDRKHWERDVRIDVGEKAAVEVPELEVTPHTAPPIAATATSPEDHAHGTSGGAIAGLVVGGVGLVGVALGSTFGAIALGKFSDSKAYCGQNGHLPDDCYPPGIALRSDAVTFGDLSTIFLIGGAVLTVTGVVMFITLRHTKAAVAFNGHGIVLSGSF